ncbi:MAG: hypothetical protein H7246_22025 [Phycisphaerae bacterium]|nr:hypothetical protein [Saprospiraceae bacterium]
MKLSFATLIFIIGFFLTLMGLLFKLESWPNASVMLVLGMPLGFVGLVLIVLNAMKTKPNIFLIIGFFLTLMGFLFKLKSYPNVSEMLMLGMLLGFVGFVLAVLNAMKKHSRL